MKNPEVVLGNLRNKSEVKDYKYRRLYRILYNKQMFYMAYENIAHNKGSMTQGTDNETISEMSIVRIDKLIESLKDLTYQPNPVRRMYIPKKNKGKRPLGIPSANDKLVQEVVRMILESIYEDSFSDSSHGFRPKKSCHTALSQIKITFNGTKWFVEGDIKGYFDNIEHHTLINLLRKRIEDERFIDLIWKFLRAGYLEDWKYHNTYSGTPQGGIISPILSNIYLHELDTKMEEFKVNFSKGRRRKRSREYGKYDNRVTRAKRKLKSPNLSKEEYLHLKKHLNENLKLMKSTPYSEPMDENYKRLSYVRYADDFLIGIIGSKEDAENMKQKITTFLREELKIELSQEKTLITNAKKPAKFLGYDIKVRDNKGTVKEARGNIQLLMPKDTWKNKLIEYKAIDMNKKQWMPIARNYLQLQDDLEIISIYNAEIRGLYNYYQYAENVASYLNMFYYFMKYSFVKSLAGKYQSSVRKIFKKFSKDGNLLVEFDTKKGKKQRYFYNEGFRWNKSLVKENTFNDELANSLQYYNRTSLIDRLRAEVCESCGVTNVPLEMHHTRKLKDLKNKKSLTRFEYLMIARNRKTIAVCIPCHQKYHRHNP